MCIGAGGVEAVAGQVFDVEQRFGFEVAVIFLELSQRKNVLAGKDNIAFDADRFEHRTEQDGLVFAVARSGSEGDERVFGVFDAILRVGDIFNLVAYKLENHLCFKQLIVVGARDNIRRSDINLIVAVFDAREVAQIIPGN